MSELENSYSRKIEASARRFMQSDLVGRSGAISTCYKTDALLDSLGGDSSLPLEVQSPDLQGEIGLFHMKYVVAIAKDRSSFYGQLLRNIDPGRYRDMDQFSSALPMVTMEDLDDHLDDVITGYPNQPSLPGVTSGSVRMKIYERGIYDVKSYFSEVAHLFGHFGIIKPGYISAHFISTGGAKASPITVGEYLPELAGTRNQTWGSEAAPEKVLPIWQRGYSPDVLIITPNNFYRWLEKLIQLPDYRNGELRDRLKYVIYGGEPLGEAQKSLIEEVFGKQVDYVNYFSSTDYGAMALGSEKMCPEGHLHLLTSVNHVAIKDDVSGQMLNRGDSGAMVVTHHHGTYFPVIGAINGDNAILQPHSELCNMKTPVFIPTGRSSDRLDLAGRRLPGALIGQTIEKILGYPVQLVVDRTTNSLTVLLGIPEQSSADHSEWIKRVFEEACAEGGYPMTGAYADGGYWRVVNLSTQAKNPKEVLSDTRGELKKRRYIRYTS